MDSVSKKIGTGKKFWIRFRSDFWYRHTLPVAVLRMDVAPKAASGRKKMSN